MPFTGKFHGGGIYRLVWYRPSRRSPCPKHWLARPPARMGRPTLAATATGLPSQPIIVVASLDGGDRGAVRSQGNSVLVHDSDAAPVRYNLDAVCHTQESAMSAAGQPVVDALLEGTDAVLLCCGGGAVAQQVALFGSSTELPVPAVPQKRPVPTIEAQLQAAPTQAERAALAVGTVASGTGGGTEAGTGGGAGGTAAWVCPSPSPSASPSPSPSASPSPSPSPSRRGPNPNLTPSSNPNQVCRGLLERLHRLASHSAADGQRRR